MMRIKPLIRKAASVGRDPLAHISLVTGDAVAIFVIGVTLGVVLDRVYMSYLFCWLPG